MGGRSLRFSISRCDRMPFEIMSTSVSRVPSTIIKSLNSCFSMTSVKKISNSPGEYWRFGNG